MDTIVSESEYYSMMRQMVDEEIVFKIIGQFTELEGCDFTELPPLQESVNVDALESLLTRADGNQNLLVQFEYNDAVVSLTGEGSVLVHPLDGHCE
ncbi:HalOD1 output domain-containing protein [Halomicroarcula sp. GCM10025324]|uniref:HalOD1 output domain-containing protein n=1 Tax=Haloarcula TaxID=2237 RepID=UPI0023E8DAF2|nr:HalOD1 output domain-containing protein [Halomicroarcula sp. ZS-22-S1]